MVSTDFSLCGQRSKLIWWQSITRVIAELVLTGARVFGKATAAAGAQAVRNFKHKPDGAPSNAPIGTGGSKSQITNQLNMSLDEAHLILNVKKEDPLEVIEKSYDRIFAANSPPAPPSTTPPAAGAPGAAGARPTPTLTPAQAAAARRAAKVPTHSHYLQSKVYRALERIKAERETGATPPAGPAAGEAGAAGKGEAGSSS
ncbi:uncharacterized protein MKK02DRAFT_38496 [Dioszegia hungarica]|uniref:Mitochondrial import inner membrane translocase subunit TIM16 n=1 Tax=Dioszegia hungarica TaxID=4972 RepID=A0AA38H463_9TREE|nr:uncharacterized protein MKK02DRAFT_38496 [Dioszegia hungarica]KAI9633833.1 hypothetical protein MKK02DRAFT_38496 [Dioszegia hungarica]